MAGDALTGRSPGVVVLGLLVALSVGACSPFETRFKSLEPGVYRVESLQCSSRGDAADVLADIAAEASRRCAGGHRLDETETTRVGTRGSFFGECSAVRVTTTVICKESTR